MPIQTIDYGRALTAATADARATTHDSAALAALTDTELHAAHAASNSATKSEAIRRELVRRGYK